MKTTKSLLCASVVTLSLIGSVNAATLKIADTSASAGSDNNTVSVSITDEDLSQYNKVEFQLSISNTFYAQITRFNPGNAGLTYNLNESGGVATYSFDAGANTLSPADLGTITFRTSREMDNSFNLTPVNVKFYKSEDGEAVEPASGAVKGIAGVVKYEKPKSSEAFLTGLTPSVGELSPAFESTVTEYKIQVRDTIQILRFTATPCAGATVSGDTVVKDLVNGENEREIKVTAEDGSASTTYKITIVKGEIIEPSAYLKDLKINNIGVVLSPSFDKMNNKYTTKIDDEIDEIDFKVDLEDPMATYTVEGNEDFKVGDNVISIKVKSSNGTDEQVYEITAIKEDKTSDEPAAKPVDEDKDEKKNMLWIIIVIVVVILLIIAGVTFVLFKKKKKKKDDSKLPLKRREGTEKTVEIEKSSLEPRHAASSDDEDARISPEVRSRRNYMREQESITEILKTELYEEDKTQKFDKDEFSELKRKIYETDDIEETKEFNFKDFE